MNMAEHTAFGLTAARGKLRLRYTLKRHSSWRVGGPADRVYVPADIEDLACFLKTLPKKEPIYVLGLGSNILIRDGGIRGTVILTHPALRAMRVVDDPRGGSRTAYSLVYAEAGVASPKLARFSAEHGLRGGEFLAGVPGTIGGALAMNAGCYGSETWNIVDRVLTVNRNGVVRQRKPEEFEVGYRSVARKTAPGSTLTNEWFVAAWFALGQGDAKTAKQIIKGLLQKRIETQPLDQPNAGSVFRNPQGDFAARLIEQCGYKGLRVGGAMVSKKHANFIVNTGSATASDIETLIHQIHQGVKQSCGVELEPEVRIIGEH